MTTHLTVEYDRKGLIIGSQRVLLFSASIHYPRCQPSDWQQLIEFAKEAGINCIETYVFWNQHEKEKGVYDFSGRLDLFGFIRTIAKAGLYALLRIGPYICAETHFGGFPHWLRDIDGIEFRTQNEPFQRESSRWVRFLVEKLNSNNCFYSQGGPIVMVQFENEYKLIGQNYGEAGLNYLKWCSELAKDLQLPVPLFMCKGSIENVLETINDFYGHQEMENHHREYPNQPAIWTECWTGWYDVWGSAHHIRPCKDLFYAVLRFFAQGGKGINYYMFHGVMTMMLLLMNTEEKQKTLKLEAPIAHSYEDNYVWIFIWEEQGSNCIFFCNDHPTSTKQVQWKEQEYCLAPLSVQMVVDHHRLILKSDQLFVDEELIQKELKPISVTTEEWTWQYYKENIPTTDITKTQVPVEMLRYTGTATDYAWYIAHYQIDPQIEWTSDDALEWVGGQVDLEAADYVQVYVNGVYKTSSPLPLLEERFPNSWNETSASPHVGFHQHMEFTHSQVLKDSIFCISFLVSSLGMIKGDWQLDRGWNMKDERKGIFGIPKIAWKVRRKDSDHTIPLKVQSTFRFMPLWMQPPLVESHFLHQKTWKDWNISFFDREEDGIGPRWYRAIISLLSDKEYDGGLLLDCKGLWKGHIWWNKQDLGNTTFLFYSQVDGLFSE
ncbi:Beta-galactosidase 3 [Galdieria sulphuraria]|nr:Beta-galactosidase 3 [Galdieria sulphuraria]